MGQLQKHWSWLQQIFGRGPTVEKAIDDEIRLMELQYIELRLQTISDQYRANELRAKMELLNQIKRGEDI